ncbi:hypothetical protein BGZ95_003979 [Linnemannia exigua]|uniref:F-box domain-containing protein n=1 Tax=Linnemannia exigua TaxID=604196 RepID=A0AAD4H936_9FUNG|nr:hypothetical protein BGZ95_003979 [Linnemannia exigua]
MITPFAMGLDSPESLAQHYAAAMAISAATPTEAPRSPSSLRTVFSIPELVEAIERYLNTSQRIKLSHVSKQFYRLFQPSLSLSLLASAFHDPPFGPPHIALVLPDTYRMLSPRVEGMALDLHSFRYDRDQNAMLETLYRHSAVALRRLQVFFWGAEQDVLQEVITALPNLEELNVSLRSSAHAAVLPEMLTRIGKARQAATQGQGKVIVHESFQHEGVRTDVGRGLRMLTIELKVPKSKNMNMSVLSELLKAWPALTSLKLTSFAFEVGSPAQPSPATTAPPPPPPPPPVTTPAPPILPSVPLYLQTAAAATGTSSGAALLQQQHQGGQPAPSDRSTSDEAQEEPSFPRLRSLKLTNCTLSPTSLRTLDQLFPRLKELKLTSCPGDWYRELAGERTSQITPLVTTSHHNDSEQPDVPFVHLQSLKVWIKEQSARNKILGLFKHRPNLTCVETDVLPDLRDGLLEAAAFSSGVAVGDLVVADATVAPGPSPVVAAAGASASANANVGAGTTDMSKVRNRIKRLAIQTYASPPHEMNLIERFYNAPAFRELEYVYMQNRELSMALFPYAKTLRELNLGGPDSVMREHELTMLNSILHRMPVLEILEIDRYVDGVGLLNLFEGFGPGSDHFSQQGGSSSTDATTTNSSVQSLILPPPPLPPTATTGEDQLQPQLHIQRTPRQERGLSYLHTLRLRYKRPEGLATPLDLKVFRTAVLERFEYLEEATIRVGLTEDLPKKKDILKWRDEFSKEKGGSAVTRCKVAFKLREQMMISVVI